MGWFLIVVGILWLGWKILEVASWYTNAYDDSGIDATKQFRDVCCNGVSKSQYKKNYKDGKYKK